MMMACWTAHVSLCGSALSLSLISEACFYVCSWTHLSASPGVSWDASEGAACSRRRSNQSESAGSKGQVSLISPTVRKQNSWFLWVWPGSSLISWRNFNVWNRNTGWPILPATILLSATCFLPPGVIRTQNCIFYKHHVWSENRTWTLLPVIKRPGSVVSPSWTKLFFNLLHPNHLN